MLRFVQAPRLANRESSSWRSASRIFTPRDCSEKLTRGRTCSPHRHLRCAAQHAFEGGGPAAVLSEIGLNGERSRPAADNNEETRLLRVRYTVRGSLSWAKPLDESVRQAQSTADRV